MTDLARLRKLQQIADLLKDRDLTRLGQASARKMQIEAQLIALDGAFSVQGLDPVVAGQIIDRFGLWTTQRRISLNQQLARETAAWIETKAQAQRSFGRAEVLGKLVKRL